MGRLIASTEYETNISVSELRSDEAVQPLQSAVVANVATAMTGEHHTCVAVNASYTCYGLPKGQVQPSRSRTCCC